MQPTANERTRMASLKDTLREIVLKTLELLRRKPAYILIFGIASLFGIGGLIVILDAVLFKTEQATTLLQYGLGSFLASLVAAVVTIKLIEGGSPRPPVPVLVPSSVQGVIPEGIANGLKGIAANVSRACTVGAPVLLQEIEMAVADLQATSADWADGKLTVSGKRYQQVLLRVYESAGQSVFSTSDTHYLAAWRSDFGSRLLEAHGRSKAQVTRIFVFDDRAEVTEAAYHEIARQAGTARITPLVYFDKEYEFFDFPPEILRDFTIVDDGHVIGITVSVAGENIAADWYFKDEDKRAKYLQLRQKLLQGAQGFLEFERWWQEHNRKT